MRADVAERDPEFFVQNELVRLHDKGAIVELEHDDLILSRPQRNSWQLHLTPSEVAGDSLPDFNRVLAACEGCDKPVDPGFFVTVIAFLAPQGLLTVAVFALWLFGGGDLDAIAGKRAWLLGVAGASMIGLGRPIRRILIRRPRRQFRSFWHRVNFPAKVVEQPEDKVLLASFSARVVQALGILYLAAAAGVGLLSLDFTSDALWWIAVLACCIALAALSVYSLISMVLNGHLQRTDTPYVSWSNRLSVPVSDPGDGIGEESSGG